MNMALKSCCAPRGCTARIGGTCVSGVVLLRRKLMSRLLAVATLLAATVSLATAPHAPGLELPGLPAVAATTPANGAVDVARGTKPSATFTLPMDGTTITEKTFTLTGPAGAVPASVSYDAVSNTAQLAPQAPLD